MISLTAIGSVVKKHIWSILGCLFSGLGVYILTVFFPQIPEFFRQPKIEVAARIDANNSITFQQRDSVLNFEADYGQLTREFLSCEIVETPFFTYFIESGYLKSEDIKRIQARRDYVLKQLAETLAIIPIRVRMKNNGFRATTIESIEIKIPSIGEKDAHNSKWENANIRVEPSSVDDIDYTVAIPVFRLMYRELIDFSRKMMTFPETPDSVRDALLLMQ